MGQNVEEMNDEDLLTLYEDTMKLFNSKKDLPDAEAKTVSLRKKLDELEEELRGRSLLEGD